MPGQESVVGVNPAVITADVGDESVLLNTDTGVYFGLDALGRQIWAMLEQGATPAEIHARLEGEYDVESEKLATDITSFLSSLRAHGLLRPAGA